eukprot:COSAG03_NODE_324_length_8972_cov_5.452271_3_plen_41_part_00
MLCSSVSLRLFALLRLFPRQLATPAAPLLGSAPAREWVRR